MHSQSTAVAKPTQQSTRATDASPCIALVKGNRNRVLAPSKRVRARTDRDWSRPGAAVTGLSWLRNSALIERLVWMHARRGARWSEHDETLISELKRRTFGAKQMRDARTLNMPAWMEQEFATRRFSRTRMLTRLLMAHRAGSIGALLSLDEWGIICQCHPRTVQRWLADLEADGWVEVVKTWVPAPSSSAYVRGWGKQLVRIGPRFPELAGDLGLLEGAAGLGPKAAAIARCYAQRARKKTRERLQQANDAHYGRQQAAATGDFAVTPVEPEPSLKTSLDTMTSPPSAPRDGNKQPGRPSREKEKKKAPASRPLVSASPPSWTPPARPLPCWPAHIVPTNPPPNRSGPPKNTPDPNDAKRRPPRGQDPCQPEPGNELVDFLAELESRSKKRWRR